MEPDHGHEYFINRAIEMGAEDAKLLAPKDEVFTGSWVRLKCQFGCGGYGERLTCPPYSPTPQETRKVLDEYESGILVHFPSEENNLKELMADLEREAFLSGYYKSFALAAGPCNFCEECNLEECKHPHKARPSMEACGIDVYKTARNAGYHIEVVKNHKQSQDYFGLLLLE
ncbi:hypothetical protein AKJ41_05770 [candidate division MSBL1 archaeon SCGC-AAA259O05]|uniref:Metal-binding protein n=1 Tax=candidate division MSBL1 archaeon SCGC-AAA259O05 TaxID=1698271 RepID=A0A133UYH4_9EURY|nr:hypothetical protein AKJ41_05770 [candidate division MSBL1 archaeon SCGC-AAA259O05]